MLRVTKTENGLVKGLVGTDARITVFKGIPYAADTSGANRWRAPQPVQNWEGVRECYEFGPITMQKVPGENPDAFYSKEWHVDPEVPMGEDSLRLNIWTPAKRADEKLPVMMWIFGGGLQEGYAHEMEFDGERIASRGVVLVSIAYRLNVFGFMCHPEITAEAPDAPANFGHLDQRCAMEWIKRNIANFGGDPDNVTIFGQSAGGGSVWTHLTSPRAEGAFARAIPESAGGVSVTYPKGRFRPRKTLAEAEQQGVEFVTKWLGVKTLEEARQLDAKFIEAKYHESGMMMGTIVDDRYVFEESSKVIREGRMLNVPIMTGNTTDEFIQGPEGEDEAGILAWVQDNFGPHAEEYLDICKRLAAREGISLKKAVSVNSFEVGARLAVEALAKHGRASYYYVFGPTIPGDDAGAFHSSDLWFEFETLMRCWRPFDGHHFDLSRKMCNYWTNFAKTGDPNGPDADGTPMVKWTAFDQNDRQNIQFFDQISMTEGPYSEKLAFLLKINQE